MYTTRGISIEIEILKQMELTLLLAQQLNCSPSSYTTHGILRETIQNGGELDVIAWFFKNGTFSKCT